MPLGGIWHQCLLFLLSASLSPKQCRNINLGLWKYVDGSGLRNRNHRLRMTVALSRGLAFIEWRPLIRARYVFRQEACQIFQEWERWSMMMTKDLAKRRSLIALHEAFWISGEAFFFFFFLFIHYLDIVGFGTRVRPVCPQPLEHLFPHPQMGILGKTRICIEQLSHAIVIRVVQLTYLHIVLGPLETILCIWGDYLRS